MSDVVTSDLGKKVVLVDNIGNRFEATTDVIEMLGTVKLSLTGNYY